MRVLLLAPPGAGKGTQGERLAEHYGIAHISSGDLLRGAIAERSELGTEVQAYLDAGDLVPDELMEDLLRGPAEKAAAEGGYVLDGFPRTLHQAQQAYLMAIEGDFELQAVLFLDVPDKELVERLVGRARGADDSETTISHRLEVYHRQTAPLADYYRERGLLLRVDGSAGVPEVTAACLAALATVGG